MTEIEIAKALATVLNDSRWIGVFLARAFFYLHEGMNEDEVVRHLYESGSITLTKAKEILLEIRDSGFRKFIPKRVKLGSAENPVTKLFPAAITEQRFLTEIDSLITKRSSIDYIDERLSGHTLVDFLLKENGLELPVNVKNAGTRFENAKQLVGLDPDDCIPIPVYKAYQAIENEPNLLYVISVDYSLIQTISQYLVPLFSEEEKITWEILNNYSGSRIRDAEDHFIYSMVLRYWNKLQNQVVKSDFRVISARKAIRILQKQPKRTPGIGLRAWGTGANAEVNVHISISEETKPWHEVFERICEKGLADIVGAINRKRTEIVYDPEI